MPGGLVFLGFVARWKPRPSDASEHLQRAERWEVDAPEWSIQDRRIHLANPDIGYSAMLGDGHADFRSESPAALVQAKRHADEILSQRMSGDGSRVVISVGAQFLAPSESTFEALTSHLHRKLYNPHVLRLFQGRLHDFAYLVDFRIQGRGYQLQIGPVRAAEIPGRVSARDLETPPDVATFCQVVGRQAYRGEVEALDGVLDGVVVVGRTIVGDLLT